MNEVKRPQKPLIFYYTLALLALMLFNLLILPKISQAAVKTVDYSTFMSMTEAGDIGKVQITSNQILFTDKAGTTAYRTGLMDDPQLTERLYKAGAEFTAQIVEETSPLLSFLLSWLLPIGLFVMLGRLMSESFDMVVLETVSNQYLGGDTSLACSAETQTEIDRKVVERVKTQHEKALHLLTENRDKLDCLAAHLYEKETITGEEFMSLLEEA